MRTQCVATAQVQSHAFLPGHVYVTYGKLLNCSSVHGSPGHTPFFRDANDYLYALRIYSGGPASACLQLTTSSGADISEIYASAHLDRYLFSFFRK